MSSEDKLTEAIIGSAIEVHRHLGPGLLETIYEQALEVELDLRGITSTRQKKWRSCIRTIASKANEST